MTTTSVRQLDDIRSRDPLFDVIKGWGIMLVVFYHVMYASPHVNRILLNLITGFVMPMFFTVSGYFLWPVIYAGDVSRLARHLRSYFIPLAIVSIFFAVCSVALGDTQVRIEEIGLYALKRFLFSSWFLWVLAECYVFCFIINRIVNAKGMQYVVLLSALVVMLFLPSFLRGVINVKYGRSMLPYFVFGSYLLRGRNWRLWEQCSVGVLMLVVYLLVVICEGDVRSNGMGFYWTDTSWRAFSSLRGAVTWFARPLMGIFGCVGFMCLTHMILRADFAQKRFAWLIGGLGRVGRATLGIYILHQWLLDRLLSIWPNLLATVGGVALTTVGLVLLSWMMSEMVVSKIK